MLIVLKIKTKFNWVCKLPTVITSGAPHTQSTTKSWGACRSLKKEIVALLSKSHNFDLETFCSHFCSFISFDCTAFKNRNQSKCYYENQVFNIGQEVGSEDLEASCTVGCSCQKPYVDGAPSKFRCGHIDCPEFLRGPIKRRGKKCISQYSSRRCCSTGAVCGELGNSFVFLTLFYWRM